ncbi:MAG: NosD domain-containing protein, partial [Promethearchaeota archaeon]
MIPGLNMMQEAAPSELDYYDMPRIPSYSIHQSFNITSDSEFASQGWPGLGTLETPYIIENLNVTAPITSILIANTSKHFVILGCWLRAEGVVWGDGIVTFDNVTNGKIEDCILIGYHTAITVYDSMNCSFTGNSIGTQIVGLLAHNLNASLFDNNIQIAPAMEYPVHVQGANSLVIKNNVFDHVTSDGIRFAFGLNCSLESNLFRNTGPTHVGQYGIVYREARDCNLSVNVIEGFESGIEILYGTDNHLFNNTVTASLIGIRLLTSNLTVTHNEIQTDNIGVDLEISNSCIIEFNDIQGEISRSVGISSRVGNNTLIQGNELHYLDIGVQLQSSFEDRVIENRIYDCLNALSLEEYAGIGYEVNHPIDAIIANNSFLGCSLSFSISNVSGLDYLISGNTINGDLLGYFFNESIFSLSGNEYGQIILVACSEATILGGDLYGVTLMYSNRCEIINVNVHHSYTGIYLYQSNDCILNTIEAESNEIAVYFVESYSCSVYRSTIHNNTYGILLDESQSTDVYGCDVYQNYNSLVLIGAHHSSIESNTIRFNNIGIQILRTSDSVVGNNEVTYNSGIGIFLNRLSSDNFIIGNSFGWNGENAECFGNENMWDDGVGRGNSWSDLPSSAAWYIIDDDDVDR